MYNLFSRWPGLTFFFLILAFSVTELNAQVYSISGKVVDAKTSEPLPGVIISIDNSNLGALTDPKGEFLLTEIPLKEIVFQVMMLGYRTDTIRHAFAQDPSPDFNISLETSDVMLGQVEVTGKAEGQIRAMIEQQQAENIKNVVSAEQIATFPDMNAAEVMQRIPGITLQRDQGEGRFVQIRGTPPELTSFNINGEQIPSPEGDVRFVGMDIIPADQIDFIEVSKVMTPDMDADGIGGSVNIKTKEAAGEIPDIRAMVAVGYSHLRQTPNYQVQYAYGQRYGRFGFNVNASYYSNQYGSDNIEYDFVKGPFFGSQDSMENNYFVQFREVQLRHYDITRTRASVSPTFDYRFSKDSYVYLRAMYNRFTDDEIRRRKIYELDDALNYEYYLYGGIVHDVRARLKIQELGTISLGGEHRIGTMSVDYQLFFASAQEQQPDKFDAAFENPGQAIAMDFDLTDPDYPKVEFPVPAHEANATDYDHYELNEMLLETREVMDINLTPRINLSIPLSIGRENEGYFKFGGKIRAKNKERNIESQQYAAYFEQPLGYPGVGPALSLTTINDGFRDEDLLNAGYLLEYMPSSDMLRDFYEFYPQHFVIDRTATKIQSFGEDYEAKERIYSTYAMVRQDFDRLMVVTGLRYEQTNIDYTGSLIKLDGNRFDTIETLTDKRTHKFLLPQVQFKYSINESINLRAALTYTYSRPNFEDVLPYREQDREEVKYGNPDLLYPQSTNIDLLAEKYFPKGILSGGLFYKRIDNFIFYFKRFAHEGDPKDFGLVEITKAINGDKAFVYGAEFQLQTKFNFLNGFISNFGVYANYTYTYSEALIAKRLPANTTDAIVIFEDDDLTIYSTSDEQEKISLPGQARHTANLALFYDTPKFFARLTANYHDDFLYQLGADKDLDEYYDEEFRLDFTANYTLSANWNVFVDVINITNTPQRYYLGTPERIKQLEFYSWWCRVGVKLDF